ncbi:MAG TPA: AbrB/MazE/SpoVT family DNA-binding domain-containing protein [Planctomycetota bacterium]|nr:AbrB/MazE/SpoVT family DNA-binding domain-containing protein [Planctomycetota bacterium]
MIKTLTKHGNSYALVIDKAILELLQIDPNQPLEITTDGEALTVRKVADRRRVRRFEKALNRTNRRYGRALKKLAE